MHSAGSGPQISSQIGMPMPHAAEIHRTGHRPRRKHPLLVEHAVIRQVHLEAQSRNPSAVQNGRGVVQKPVLDPGRAHDHGRSALAGLARERFHGLAAGGLKGRLQHQVLRRIAGNEQFREQDQVGVHGLRARGTHSGRIAGDVSDNRIELGQGNGELTCGRHIHGHGLARPTGRRQCGRISRA